ncbi:MAG: antibiotic biosynthesis monooxygenase family protein [Candidatus Puniceispirillales bacterium]
MVIVVFEFELKPSGGDRYFELAAALREELEKQPGFIAIERFESLSTKGRFVSIQSWKDDASVKAWRDHAEHRLAQEEGKESLFSAYRLRVANVFRDYTD